MHLWGHKQHPTPAVIVSFELVFCVHRFKELCLLITFQQLDVMFSLQSYWQECLHKLWGFHSKVLLSQANRGLSPLVMWLDSVIQNRPVFADMNNFKLINSGILVETGYYWTSTTHFYYMVEEVTSVLVKIAFQDFSFLFFVSRTRRESYEACGESAA